jgi:hypothetical protein
MNLQKEVYTPGPRANRTKDYDVVDAPITRKIPVKPYSVPAQINIFEEYVTSYSFFSTS